MIRKKTKAVLVCSSDNYRPKQTFRPKQVIRTTEVHLTRQKYYVRCLGRLVEITREQALIIKDTVEIIQK